MNRSFSKRSFAIPALVLLPLLALSISCESERDREAPRDPASSPSRSAKRGNYVPMVPGASWTFVSTGDKPRTYKKKVIENRTVGGLPCVAVRDELPGTEQTVVFHVSENCLRIVALDEGLEKPVDWLRLPPEVGTRWTDTVRFGSAPVKLTFEIDAREKVEVPAGAYEAVRLSIHGVTRDGDEIDMVMWFAEGVGEVQRRIRHKSGKDQKKEVTLVLKSFDPGKEVPVPPAPEGQVVARHEGATVTFPAGTLKSQAPELQTVQVRAEPADSNQVRVSKAYAIRGQAVFSQPIRVELPYDSTLLPPGVPPEQIYPVLARDGFFVRIRGAKVDAERKLISFDLKRTVPMIDFRPTTANESLYVSAVADRLRQVKLDEGVDFEIWAPESIRDRALPRIAELKASLERTRRSYSTFSHPGKVYCTFARLKSNVSAAAMEGDSILCNIESEKSTGLSTISHEYFHLIQQTYSRANLERAGYLVTDETLYGYGRWISEASATYMESTVGGEDFLKQAIGDITPEFFHRSLATHEGIDVAGFPQQYEGAAFFRFLAEHYDAPAIIRRFYEKQLTQESMWDELYVLEEVLQTQADRRGRTRALGELYTEFLLRFPWMKDFEPVTSAVNADTMGVPGEIRTLDDKLTRWSIPGTGGARRTKCSASAKGEPYSIVRSFEITQAVASDGSEQGELVLRLSNAPSDPANADRVAMMVFPTTRAASMRPLFGGPGKPVTVKQWEANHKLIVWVVDVSRTGKNDLTLEAEFIGTRRTLPSVTVRTTRQLGSFDSLVVNVAIDNMSGLGLKPEMYAGLPKHDRGSSIYWLLRFDYDGMRTYNLERLSEGTLSSNRCAFGTCLRVRRTGDIPVVLTVYTGSSGMPVLRKDFTLTVAEPAVRKDLTPEKVARHKQIIAKLEDTEKDLAAKWRKPIEEQGNYYAYQQWVRASVSIVSNYRDLYGFPYFVAKRDVILRGLDRRLEVASARPWHAWAGKPRMTLDSLSAPLTRLWVLVTSGMYVEANEYLKQVEKAYGKAGRPAGAVNSLLPPRKLYEDLIRGFRDEQMNPDLAEEVFRRFQTHWEEGAPEMKMPDPERTAWVRGIRRFFPAEAFE